MSAVAHGGALDAVAFSSRIARPGKGQVAMRAIALAGLPVQPAAGGAVQLASRKTPQSAIERKLPRFEAVKGLSAMLITLILLVVAFISGVQWQSAIASSKADTVPTITPQDPSSLTLALIGAGMLAVYFAVSRTIRGRRPPMMGTTKHFSDRTTDAAPADVSDSPRKSRGAA